jgi:hypothetical protein
VVQTESGTSMELDSEPTIDANVYHLFERTPASENSMDLAAEPPTPRAEVTVTREVSPGSCSLGIDLRLWKASAGFALVVQAPQAPIAPLSALVLAEAVAAACLVPHLTLSSTASDALRAVVAGSSGLVALAAGLIVVLSLLRKSR